MAFINIPGKDNSTTLSPDEFNYFVNKVNSLKLAILQGSGFVGALRISDIPDIDGWYFASESGVYTNAGNLSVQLDGNLNVIVVSNFGTTFSLIETPIPQGEALETEVIQHSLKGVESDGIWNALYGTGSLSESITSVREDTDTNTQNILALVGGLNNQGQWDATLNIPDIDAIASINDYWIVKIAGATSLDGETSWDVGDWAVYTSNGWTRIDAAVYLNGTSIEQTLSISGLNVSISGGNTITIPMSDTQRTDEEIRDVAASQWINGTNTTIVYDDVLNTLKINSTDTLYDSTSLDNHIANVTTNPHNVTKSNVGLGNVDNTSDNLKPVSIATQNALDLKVDDSQVLTDVPAGALFTDTTYTSSDFTHDSLTGFVAAEHIDWAASSTGTIHITNLPATAITSVQISANETAMLALTTQEGDVVVRSDESQTYMHNGGTAGTMADFTELSTPTSGVTSVDGATGAVTLNHDTLSGYVGDEHIDWTSFQLAKNIHSGNYTDTIYTLPFTDNSANWNTAFGWGDHSTAGYTGNQDLSGYVLSTTLTSYLRSNVNDIFTGRLVGHQIWLGGAAIASQGASTAKLQVNGFQRTGNIYLHEGGNTPTVNSKILGNNAGALEWGGNDVWHAGNLTITGSNTGDQDLSGYLLNTTDTLTGTLTIASSATPLKFEETGYTGQGKYWRHVQDGGNLRFDSCTVGDGGFTPYVTTLALGKNGSVQFGALGAGILKTNSSGVVSLDTNTYALASSITGTNTGDQDLSGYLLNTTDILNGNLTVTGNITGADFIQIKEAGTIENVPYGIGYDSVSDFSHTGNDSTVRWLNHYGIGVHKPLGANATGGRGVYMAGYFGLDFFTAGANRLHIAQTGESTFYKDLTISNTGSARLVLLGDSNNVGDTGQEDAIIDFLGDGGTYGYRLNSENWSSKSAFNIQENKNGTYTSRLYIDNTGDVGIGTDSPDTKLTVSDSTNPTIRINNTKAGTWVEGEELGGLEFYGNDGSGIAEGVKGSVSMLASGVYGDYFDMAFSVAYTSNTYEAMRLTAEGNLGIGTDSPLAKFHINNTEAHSMVSLSNCNNIKNAFRITGRNSATNSLAIGSFNNTDYVMQVVNNAGNVSGKMLINPYGGNVGIGKKSPDAKLEVVASVDYTSIKLSRWDTTGDTIHRTGISTQNYIGTEQDTAMLIGYVASGQSVISLGGSSGNHNAATKLRFYTAANSTTITGTERMTILSNGYVGINDPSPSYQLDVAGTIRATGDVIAYSDIRVKKNINTIENAVDTVNKLRGVTYQKKTSDEYGIGVIAQELEEVLPSLVKTDSKGMKAVAYGNITGVLIEAIKEQDKKIERLEALVEQMLKNK